MRENQLENARAPGTSDLTRSGLNCASRSVLRGKANLRLDPGPTQYKSRRIGLSRGIVKLYCITMLIKVGKMSQEEFNVWLRSSYSGAFYVAGHKFEKTDTDGIRVDGGTFSRDDAAQLYRLLTSRNLITQINALLSILERNGTLLWILLGVSLIMMLLVIMYHV